MARAGYLVGGILLLIFIGLPGAWFAYAGFSSYEYCSSLIGPYASSDCGLEIIYGIVGVVLALVGLIGGVILLVKSRDDDPFPYRPTPASYSGVVNPGLAPYGAPYSSSGLPPPPTAGIPTNRSTPEGSWASDTATRIARLQDLLAHGAITPEEFQSQKSRILVMSDESTRIGLEARARIDRLRALVDNGTITPAEFESQRMKILRAAGLATPDTGASQELARLRALHIGGQVSDADYQTQRQAILDRF
jgi:hypothetical protein